MEIFVNEFVYYLYDTYTMFLEDVKYIKLKLRLESFCFVESAMFIGSRLFQNGD